MKFILEFFLIFSLSVNAAASDVSSSNEVASIKDILDDFTYQLKPIHPGCVREFEVSLADSPPPIVRSVDVRACVKSNELYMPFKTGEDGYESYEYDIGQGEKGTFAYKYIGKSDNGIFVLATRSNTGGTMVAESIFLVLDYFSNYWDFDIKGKKSEDRRLIITNLGQIPLGDRDSGTVTLNGNKLALGASQYRDTEVTIDLGKFKTK